MVHILFDEVQFNITLTLIFLLWLSHSHRRTQTQVQQLPWCLSVLVSPASHQSPSPQSPLLYTPHVPVWSRPHFEKNSKIIIITIIVEIITVINYQVIICIQRGHMWAYLRIWCLWIIWYWINRHVKTCGDGCNPKVSKVISHYFILIHSLIMLQKGST